MIVIQAECDGYHTYLSNGDDGYCLVFGTADGFEVLDCVGDWGDDPGSGWDVAGVSAGTKDHTIVRKADVTSGNAGDWEVLLEQVMMTQNGLYWIKMIGLI